MNISQIADVVVNNLLDTPHPVHLHGHRFWVAGAGYKQGANTSSCLGTPQYQLSDNDIPMDNRFDFSGCVFDPVVNAGDLNFTQPPYPDTVVVAPKSWVYLRIRFDNPGAWVFECVRQMGMDMGSIIIFMVGDTTPQWPSPPPGTPGCGCVSTEQLAQESQAATDSGSSTSSTSSDVPTPQPAPAPQGGSANYAYISYSLFYLCFTVSFILLLS